MEGSRDCRKILAALAVPARDRFQFWRGRWDRDVSRQRGGSLLAARYPGRGGDAEGQQGGARVRCHVDLSIGVGLEEFRPAPFQISGEHDVSIQRRRVHPEDVSVAPPVWTGLHQHQGIV